MRGNAVRLRVLSIVCKTKVSYVNIAYKVLSLKLTLFQLEKSIGKVFTSVNNHSSACCSEIRACCLIALVLDLF